VFQRPLARNLVLADMRARRNVILDFIGKLGRDRVNVMKEAPVDIPSDILCVLFTDVDARANGRTGSEGTAGGSLSLRTARKAPGTRDIVSR